MVEEAKICFLDGDPDVFDIGGELDEEAKARFLICGGEHDDHIVTVLAEKHNCGAFGETVECQCGARWQSAMYGCWQHDHQRAEAGDPRLGQLLQLGACLWQASAVLGLAP